MTNRFTSVWDAIEDSASAAASMKLRAQLAHELIEELKRRKLPKGKAAALLNATEPRITDLLQGRVDRLSLDDLVDMAQFAGLKTSLTVKSQHAA